MPQPRIITILCLIQGLFIVAGALIARSFLRIYDRVMPEVYGPNHMPRIPPLAAFVRTWGLWVLLLPLICAVLYALAESNRSRALIPSNLPFLICVAITFVVIAVFSIGAVRAINVTWVG